MEQKKKTPRKLQFYRLKVEKKQQLTKNTFVLELAVPEHLLQNFQFEAGQYVTIKYKHENEFFEKDFSMTNAPFESGISLAIKVNSDQSSTKSLYENYQIGDDIEVSEPRGRFTVVSKPHEFRTILCFAAGIGITPILSHLKNLLQTEPRTRIFLFYGNKSVEETAFKNEIDELAKKHQDRFEVHYFYSRQKQMNSFFEGRLDERKLNLIINQILHLDDTDEESTIWDAVDEVLICGKGEMIKSLANACYENGIPKKNIHFELFEEFNEDIYPVKQDFPLVENIEVEFIYNGALHQTTLENNKFKLLQQLLVKGFNVPYSCKSGICGICECHLEQGNVELLENEYLTENEEEIGNILACMSIVLSKKVRINFDEI